MKSLILKVFMNMQTLKGGKQIEVENISSQDIKREYIDEDINKDIRSL